MTAICKTIAVHGNHLSALLDYGSDDKKTAIRNDDALSNLFHYAQNESKTSFVDPLTEEMSLLVTGVQCVPEHAEEQFNAIKELYEDNKLSNSHLHEDKKQVIAIHLIQSFKETSISPLVAHRVGLEMLQKSGYMGVVDTHMNKTHVHNHIIINAYHPDGKHKILLDKKTILKLRKTSDEIQMEYGIPIDFHNPSKQLAISKDSMHYGEWNAIKNKSSWKMDLYNTIKLASYSSFNHDDYIAFINRFGYELAEIKKNGDLIWYSPDKTKKISETKLMQEYEPPHKAKSIRKDLRFDYLETYYSWDGRQLSNIENTLRATHNTIVSLSNFLTSNAQKFRRKVYDFDFRQKENIWAQNCKSRYNVNTYGDVNSKLNDIGISLSVNKKQIKDLKDLVEYYRIIGDLATSIQVCQSNLMDLFNYDSMHIDLQLPSFKPIDVSKNNATIMPLSPEQKRTLYHTMKQHPEYRLEYSGKHYSNVSFVDYYNIINFFKYGGKCPSCLTKANEFNFNFLYDRQYEALKQRLSYPPTKKQIAECCQLMKDNGFDDKKYKDRICSLADVINIQNCYTPVPNLGDKLDNSKPSSTDLEKCKAACKRLNYIPEVSFENLTKKQCSRLTSWAVSQGMVPKCLQETISEAESLKLFEQLIECYPDEVKSILRDHRKCAVDLRKLGLSPEQADSYLTQSSKIKHELSSLKHKQAVLSSQYKDLLHLRQVLDFSCDKTYLYGSQEIENAYREDQNKDSKYYNTILENQKLEEALKHEKDFDIDF